MRVATIRISTLLLLIVITTTGSSVLCAQAESEAATGRAEKLAGAVHRPGFFDTWEKGDHLYLEIESEDFGREFLLVPRIGRGIGARGVVGGLMYDRIEASVVTLEQRGDRVFLLEMPHRFTASDAADLPTVERSFGASVLAGAKIEDEAADGTVLIDIQSWVVSDLLNLERMLREALSTEDEKRSFSLDPSRSYLETVKAFPRNLEIRSQLTFRAAPPVEHLDSVPDPRYVPISLHLSLIQPADEPLPARVDDDRFEFLPVARRDVSRRGDSTFFTRLASRWRLVPGERVGELHRPVEPLVFYIDPTIPERYRSVVEEGIEGWNVAFEAAGFVDAIRAEPLPEGAEPADIRYPTVSWIASDRRVFSAVGNPIADPRTGELLDADVLVEASALEATVEDWRHLGAPRALADGFCAADDGAAALLVGLAGAALAEPGTPPPMPEAWWQGRLRWLILHEVGHALGLHHNFRGSTAIPFDKLHDRAYTAEHGLSGSVMDYVSVNLAPVGEENGDLFSTTVGAYDRLAIAYLYTPDPERARQLARQAAAYPLGGLTDAYAPGSLDPMTQLWDLSDDPLRWSDERSQLIVDLLPHLPATILDDDAPRGRLTEAVHTLIDQYFHVLGVAVRYVGGQVVHRDHVGDPGARPPFVPVPEEQQRRALEMLAKKGLSADPLPLPDAVLEAMGGRHWTHWGEPPTYGGRVDPPWPRWIAERQRDLLQALTDPHRLTRMSDAEARFGSATLTLDELMTELTGIVWRELDGRREIAPLRRELQLAHLERLVELHDAASSDAPPDASALARRELRQIHRQAKDLLREETRQTALSSTTLAHLDLIAFRIRSVLEGEAAGR